MTKTQTIVRALKIGVSLSAFILCIEHFIFHMRMGWFLTFPVATTCFGLVFIAWMQLQESVPSNQNNQWVGAEREEGAETGR